MKDERDICDRLEAMASTVHGGAYATMHAAMREIKRLRSTPVEARGMPHTNHEGLARDEDGFRYFEPLYTAQQMRAYAAAQVAEERERWKPLEKVALEAADLLVHAGFYTTSRRLVDSVRAALKGDSKGEGA